MLEPRQRAPKWAKANEKAQANEKFYHHMYHKSSIFTPKIVQNPVPAMIAPEERLPEALIWARQHPEDKLSVVARLFKVNIKTLSRHMRAGTDGRSPRGGQNRILTAAQHNAVLKWVQEQSSAYQYPTKKMVYTVIARMKKEEDPYRDPPSWRWFQQWFKSTNALHTVRTKPISYKRVGAHDLTHIEHWFFKYKEGLAKYKITTDNLYNIDETNVQIACLIGQEVVVPSDIVEVYEETPENRRSITVMETLYTNSTVIYPIVIISGKQHMESWWHLRQPDEGEESYTLSESGYTNDQLTMKWFKHFLAQIGREVQLEDTTTLDIEYGIPHFIRDLPWIRSQANKVDNIKHAFRDAGVWPANVDIVKKNMARFIKTTKPNQLDGIDPEPSLPPIPKTYIEGVVEIEELNRKIPPLLSSPTRQRYRNTIDRITTMLYQGDLSTISLNILREKVNNQRTSKVRSRKVIQVGGELTPAVALAKLKEKRIKEAELEEKKARKALDTKLRALHKQLDEDGKAARRQQKANNKEVTELQKAKLPIPEALLIPVYDPSKDQAQLDRIKKVEVDWLEAQAEGFSTQEMDMLAQMGDEFELQRDQILIDIDDDDDNF
ncbi:DDE superfamily endonuclease protein [Rutstroemia sp. NJR-2017a WRK4]|nr:DDE superfamily endonuclease protein [Rutstroemia sp. NJR-2017a WRK4]